jgi:hypothetical protein
LVASVTSTRTGAHIGFFSPEGIQASSASAMLVEPDAVWLGLKHRGEWGDSSSGIAGFDRDTEAVKTIVLHEIVTGIARIGDVLVLEGTTLRRYLIDQSTDGRLRVVEGLSMAADVLSTQSAPNQAAPNRTTEGDKVGVIN